MDGKTQRAVVTAAVVGLLAAMGAGVASAEHEQGAAKGDKAPCYGINKCKGAGSCGGAGDRKSTRLNSSHSAKSRMPSSA